MWIYLQSHASGNLFFINIIDYKSLKKYNTLRLETGCLLFLGCLLKQPCNKEVCRVLISWTNHVEKLHKTQLVSHSTSLGFRSSLSSPILLENLQFPDDVSYCWGVDYSDGVSNIQCNYFNSEDHETEGSIMVKNYTCHKRYENRYTHKKKP